MRVFGLAAIAAVLLSACTTSAPGEAPSETSQAPSASMGDILAQSPASDWQALDPENTIYLELARGRVVIELAPAFAPAHVANIKALAREGYFDGAAIVRVQDNYVAQWARSEESPREIRSGQAKLAAEFDRPSAGVGFAPLVDPDTYADEVGFAEGLPAARGGGRIWLAHCYGMVGAGRDNDANSGGGAELYAVIGHAPRHLDRNVTLVGRIVQGMDLLSALPRGTGDLGFYVTAAERTPIRTMRVAADVPQAERANLETLRTDSATFQPVVESRRFRREEWFATPTGRINVCNVPLPVRARS